MFLSQTTIYFFLFLNVSLNVYFSVYSLACSLVDIMLLLQDLRFTVIVLLLRVNCLHGSNLFSASSYEFTAYRMQQYNLAKQNHGKLRASHHDFLDLQLCAVTSSCDAFSGNDIENGCMYDIVMIVLLDV